jgi:hypothetical protein
MKVRHPKLDKNEAGQLIMFCPSQSKTRNTESLYNIETGELFMAGIKVEKHPKFKDIVQFENWCNVYWVKHYKED